VHRQTAILRNFAGQSINARRISTRSRPLIRPSGPGPRIFTFYQLLAICCVASGNYATIANYLERELRYMDAGE
jgi:hypothetical protein